jgi:hypothetical protein
MMRNVFDSLLEAAERLLEKPEPPAPEPAPARPEPAGLADLPPAVRQAVEPFLRRFTVTNITRLPPNAPEPEPSYGRGEQGYQAWLLRNLELQAAEYYRARDGLPLLTDAERRRIMRPARRPPRANRPAQPEPAPEPTAALPEELRLQAQALGWSAEALDQLARLLRPGDRLGTVTALAIEIIRRAGVIQHYYHPTAPQPWRLRVGREQTEATNDA